MKITKSKTKTMPTKRQRSNKKNKLNKIEWKREKGKNCMMQKFGRALILLMALMSHLIAQVPNLLLIQTRGCPMRATGSAARDRSQFKPMLHDRPSIGRLRKVRDVQSNSYLWTKTNRLLTSKIALFSETSYCETIFSYRGL